MVRWVLGLFLPPINFKFAAMGIYHDLRDEIKEVDIVIAGGKQPFGRSINFSQT
jgi:hypothetical protein